MILAFFRGDELLHGVGEDDEAEVTQQGSPCRRWWLRGKLRRVGQTGVQVRGAENLKQKPVHPSLTETIFMLILNKIHYKVNQ